MRSPERTHGSTGRHPSGSAVAVDQPQAGCAAGAPGPAAGLRALARRHGRSGGSPTGAAGSPFRDLPLPSVAVGNLTVGGSGKTPIAIWIAHYYVSRGLVPGILLRGYGGDETLVHQHAVPEAIVIADPDRAAGRGAGAGPGSGGAGAG